ncbi:uncharacterized protein LOC116251180 [Nymphaea colorata]|nr:uncharacterized protein LOC116251180 [Nymphaea colorata]
MQNLRLHSAISGDLARHEKHSVRTVVPLGRGSSPSRETESPASLLEEERFFSRLLSRESNKGFSSRAYYRTAGKVPFEWEIAPGKPKNPTENDNLPPLSPPPLVTHHLLPRNPRRKRSRFWFMKLRVARKKAPGGSPPCDGVKPASFGDLGGVTATSDCCQFDFPASQKDFRWPGSGRSGCFPFDLTRIFISDSGR